MQWHYDKRGGKETDIKPFAESEGINHIFGVSGDGLHPEYIVWGSNGGHQAMCLAYLKGAGREFLLGYDMQRTGGKNHWFGDHEGFTNGKYSDFVPHFDKMAMDCAREGLPVINLTRETALTQFPRSTIDEYPDFHRIGRPV